MNVTIKATGFAVALAATLVMSGCTPPDSVAQSTESVVAEENPYGGFPVDLPADTDVVMSLVHGEDTTDITMGELRQMVTTEITILEPFVEEQQTFAGVPLADLFALGGFEPTDSIATIALNDYRYVDTVQAFASNDALLAVLRDGEPIPMDQGGPVRIVFPTTSDYFTLLDAWNWSLRTIELVE